eukprot:jgi/Undpi1/7073/HiC_scaffold_22.g09547.m1
MAGNAGKKKKKKTKKTKADATPRRSSLTPEQKQRVNSMHEILGEVWEPFKTGDGAIRGLERGELMSAIKTVPCRCSSSPAATLAEPAPSLEIEFWDSLAEAFLRYYGKAITLKVDTAGLARDKKAAAEAAAAAQSLVVAEVSTAADVSTGDDITQEGAGSGAVELRASIGDGSRAEQVDGLEGEGGKGVEEGGEQDGRGERLEMLQMGLVGHLDREERLVIIRKMVPMEKRVVVLHRLFYLAQAPPDDVKRLVSTVKELGNSASPSLIRDVNLLETWQEVREERSAAWDAATEEVRLAAAETASPVPPEEDGTPVAADPATADGPDGPAGS